MARHWTRCAVTLTLLENLKRRHRVDIQTLRMDYRFLLIVRGARFICALSLTKYSAETSDL
jgi:hypothetical protein